MCACVCWCAHLPRHQSKVREYLASVIKHRCIINIGDSNSLYKLEHGSRKKLNPPPSPPSAPVRSGPVQRHLQGPPAKSKFLAVKKGKQAYTGPLQFLASRPPFSVPRQNACRSAVQAHAPNEIAERGSGHPESSRFPALAWKMISRLTIRARCRTSRIRSRPIPPACSPALPLSFPKHPSPPRICPGIPDRQSFSP